MARIGQTAQKQINDLVDYYLDHNRPEAIDNLRAAVVTALARVELPSTRPRRFPATYSGLASLGMLWLREHVYWFGYGKAADGVTTIVNVIHESANIPARVEPLPP
jgi:plasmid stabilization system protein ParE